MVKYLSTIELPGIKLYQEKEVKMNFLLFNWDFSQKLWHWQKKTRKKLDERCFSNFLSFFMQEKNFNVTLEDVSRDMGMLSLQGPLSRRILQKLTPGNTDLSEEGFPFSTCQTLTVAGHQVHRLENRCLFPNIYNMKNQFWAGLGSRANTVKTLGPKMSKFRVLFSRAKNKFKLFVKYCSVRTEKLHLIKVKKVKKTTPKSCS